MSAATKENLMRRLTMLCLATVLTLGLAAAAEAWKPVPNGAALDISYTEPSTNTDGTPLTDLAKIRIYWRCTPIGGGVVCPATESIVDIPATKLTGGGVVVNNNSVITPVKCQQSASFTLQASALDNEATVHESPRTLPATTGTVDRSAEACPVTVPQTPAGIGAQ